MINKDKSVAKSKAGSALVTVSGVVLFFGIVASIIIIATSFHDSGRYAYSTDIVFEWTGLASAIEVLFGSIFVYVFGKTIAKIANYAEAIYKQQNSDYQYDSAIENGCRFLPGEKAKCKIDDIEQEVTIRDIIINQGYYRYLCVFPTGEEKEVRSYDLHDLD